MALYALALFYVPPLFVLNLVYRPWARFYNPFIKGTCLDISECYHVSGVLNFVLDVAVLCLPQNIIWSLQMSAKKKKKKIFTAIFSVGLMLVHYHN